VTASSTVPDGGAPGPEPSARRSRAVLAVLASAVQLGVLAFTFLMGLGWGGLTYLAALLQAAAALVVIARLAGRKGSAVLLVPVLSAALTAALAIAGQVHGRATACSDLERAAVSDLAPPPGTAVELEGNYTEGCLAVTRMNLSNETIVEHYRAEFARHGWEETPGRNDATIGIAAVKDGIHVHVDVNPADEDGAQMIEVVVGEATGAAPCLVNTVDPYLERRRVSEVEPGSWVVLASTVDEPASVVIRDSSAVVVFEQRAHRQPEDSDDFMAIEVAIEESSGGTPSLSLQEGAYEVECRPGDGAASTVPLRVAWASGADAEEPKNVVLRVFETPDHWK
jgi:hypothetical protein